MLNIKILLIGSLKERYWQEAEDEYLKRLKPYAKIEITKLPEKSFGSSDNPDQIKKIEAEKIKKHLDSSDVIVALQANGKQMDSTEFADFLNSNSTRGEKITFIIGGPLGLHESILEKANYNISLSKLTFTHQMARVILVEQIYRAATIINNKKYHY